MQPRSFLMGLVAAALACTPTSDDDTAQTEAQGTSSSASTGGAGSSGEASSSTSAGASTGAENPSTGAENPTTGAENPTTGAGEGSTGEPGTGSTGGGVVSFTEVYEQVILPNSCNSGYCHGNAAGGLEMTDEATSYANLVEVSATTAACGQSMRVVPGSLEMSILWYRVRPAALDDGPPCAPKMKPASMGLSEAEAQLVSDWIAGGALE